MSPRARRFLHWTFVLGFFTLAPVVILSTAGYRYNFERGRLERTGVLAVESRPNGASVSLNDTLQKDETPAVFGKIPPGAYTVRVEKSGFHPWTKTVSVGSRETVFLNRISLFRNEPPVPLARLELPAASSFSPDARYGAAVGSASSGSEVTVIDLENGSVHLPYRSSATAGSFALAWSQGGRFLLITRRGAVPTFLLWNAHDPERVRDLSSATGLAMEEAFWAQDTDRLYGSAAGTLYEIDLALLSPAPKGPVVAAPLVSDGIVYGIAKQGAPVLLRRALAQDAYETIAHLPSADFLPLSGTGQAIAYTSPSEEQLFAILTAGERPTAFEVRGHDGTWSGDGSRLLYWNDLEIHLYDTRTRTDALVNRLSTPILQAAWQRPEWTMVYASGNALYGTETSEAFGRLTTPLAAFQEVRTFAISQNGDTLFAFGRKDDVAALWKMRLR